MKEGCNASHEDWDKMIERLVLQIVDTVSCVRHWKLKIAPSIGGGGDVQERVFKQDTELRESC